MDWRPTSASFFPRTYGFFSRPREARELTTSGDVTLQNKRVRRLVAVVAYFQAQLHLTHFFTALM